MSEVTGESGGVATATTSYTHEVCLRCGATLYCSEADPWEPQREWGWCWHVGDDDAPEVVSTALTIGVVGYRHYCSPEAKDSARSTGGVS